MGISYVITSKLIVNDRCPRLRRRSRSPVRQKVVLLLLVAVDVLIELVRFCSPKDERSVVVILGKGRFSHGFAGASLYLHCS